MRQPRPFRSAAVAVANGGGAARRPRGRTLAWAALYLCGVLGASCGPPPLRAGIDPEIHVFAGVGPVPLDATPLAAEPGFREASWVVGGAPRSASLWLPEGPPRSVIVMLHGAVVRIAGAPVLEPPTVAVRMLRCLGQPAFAAQRSLVIAPHSADGQWWKNDDTAFVLGLVAAARQRWPGIGSRSAITGYSNGGIATWYFARLYPEWFSAAIPMAFNDMIVGATRIPVYAIQGDKDEMFEFEPVRAALARERARGTDVTLSVRHRAGHMTPCAYAPELSAAGQWLESYAFAQRAPRRPSP